MIKKPHRFCFKTSRNSALKQAVLVVKSLPLFSVFLLSKPSAHQSALAVCLTRRVVGVQQSRDAWLEGGCSRGQGSPEAGWVESCWGCRRRLRPRWPDRCVWIRPALFLDNRKYSAPLMHYSLKGKEEVHAGQSLFLCRIKALEVRWVVSTPHSKLSTDQDNVGILLANSTVTFSLSLNLSLQEKEG